MFIELSLLNFYPFLSQNVKGHRVTLFLTFTAVECFISDSFCTFHVYDESTVRSNPAGLTELPCRYLPASHGCSRYLPASHGCSRSRSCK